MNDFLTADEILKKAKESKADFKFKTKLLVIEQIEVPRKNNNPFLKLILKDKTNELRNVRKWLNNPEELKDQKIQLAVGNILEITGEYNKRWGINITSVKILNPVEYKLEDFTQSIARDKGELINILSKTISSIQDNKLKKLLELMFSNDEIKSKFYICPSSIKNHHAYKHGNLEHTVGMLKIFQQLEKYYNRDTNLNVDLIYTGIILHDIGKIFEYKLYNGVPRYIEGSELQGHLVLGAQLISNYMNKIENFPKDLKNRIRHLILSHHGKKEWDSVVEPQIAEADILHLLDMLDSRFKLNN